MSARVRIIAGVVAIIALGATVFVWATSGRESTDDAQVEAHVTPIAARVGGTVLTGPVADNQPVEAGTILVEIDTREYQLALDRARAELATADADAVAASTSVPIASTTTTSGVSSAEADVQQADASVAEATHSLEASTARLESAQARLREQEANAARDARDAERLKGLLAKDEISRQQFETATAQAEASRAAADSARSLVREAELTLRVAESRITQAKVGQPRAAAGLRLARTGPEQVAAARARARSAAARVKQWQAAVGRAELDLEHAVVKAPVAGIVSRKSVEPGQVIQAGQPLMTVIPLDRVWVTANFKETQLDGMRPGQRVSIAVDAYGGRSFAGKVDSIAAATGSRFSLLPPENASGNFVKVVQRVPVKIVLDAGQDREHLLRPGMSVTPTVYTK
jgi:membrane fusion protein (multidrug efflux system)